MALPVFDSEDEVPEAFRSHYEQRDGKWQAKVPSKPPTGGSGDLEASVQRLERALESERGQRRDAEQAAREAESARAELEQKSKAGEAGVTDDQLKELRTQVRADLEKEYAAKAVSELPESWKAREEAQGVLGENRTLKLDNQVKALAAKHGVRGERIDAWWRQFNDRFDLTDDGKPMVKESPGTEVTKFIEGDLKKELPDFYVGTQAAGGGAGGIQRDGKPVAGTGADDVLKNPAGALNAARQAGAA